MSMILVPIESACGHCDYGPILHRF